MVTKAEGKSAPNFVVCLCHQHPVGTTDVQMMSCGKGIGREGGVIRAREDSGQAEPRSERGERKGGRRGALLCPAFTHLGPFQSSQDVTLQSLEHVEEEEVTICSPGLSSDRISNVGCGTAMQHVTGGPGRGAVQGEEGAAGVGRHEASRLLLIRPGCVTGLHLS
ncbi:hypothetical protein EYF80_017903 [Liparis tanakae]|uniref:Uncharacterized protein n=1 Tax=Liparis tanakae TaxID=230148 RepID=A0A4Z2I1G0_9TELE|nr:hypothetical protein EYF80_017903 [Liparis tanakae]